MVYHSKNRIVKTAKSAAVVLVLAFSSYAYQRPYKLKTVAFYNVENLFDTIDNAENRDEDFTPKGKNKWTPDRYAVKIEHLAFVLADIGKDVSKTTPDIIGLAEIENKNVLQDLVDHPHLKPENYGILHFDSQDQRGIDVAMLYKKSRFVPLEYKAIPFKFQDKGKTITSRDILLVMGKLDEETYYIVINHWPSRRGGAKRSSPHRQAAAAINKSLIDSIQNTDYAARIIGMGDFNDNPTDKSFKEVLNAKASRENLNQTDIFNPMEAMYKKNEGTLSYRNSWHLFDQIYVSASVLNNDNAYNYWKAGIYNKQYITDTYGRYAGSPKRTFSGSKYTGGYSDHYPVYIYLIKQTQ